MALLQTASKLAHEIISGALDLIYPPYCVVCNREGEHYLCLKCLEEIDLIGLSRCRKCGMPVERACYTCSRCRDHDFAFESACSAAIYEGALMQAIHALKYEPYIIMLAEPLGDILARSFATTYLKGKVDFVVPIPIHRSRMLERGFNQAEELSKRMCSRIGLPLEKNALVKIRKTPQQASLTYEERLVNIKGAFAVKDRDKVIGRRILLVDDVFTTGSTLREAAETLKNAGATAVHCYTLAKSL